MSKMDELRALREARYERSAARAAGSVTPQPRQPAVVRAAGVPATDAGTGPPQEQACGHRSINGRTCTREHGHAARSHRYT
jgi:hypothetical protein